MSPNPFLPVASIDDVLAFNPADASTYTPSPLVNAVAEVLSTTHLLEANDVADYLQLDRRKLSCALQIELGMSLRDVIKQYRINEIRSYIRQHPDDTLNDVALHTGYSSDNAIWRLFLRNFGTTPNGQKSTADKAEWRQKMEKLASKSQN